MNILVPIASKDKYFSEGNYVFPKPLFDIAGSPLVEHTIKCLLQIKGDFRFTVVVQEEDCRSFALDSVLRMSTKDRDANIVKLRAPTQGAICSCLMAINYFDPDEELIIANSDQVIHADLNDIISDFRKRKLDGGVVTFDTAHPRFSYIRIDETATIVEVDEKNVISRLGIAGVYYFRRSSDFVQSAAQVLINNSPIQGAFYISQALNEMILAGKILGHCKIPSESYFPLYSPQKITEYEDELFSARHAPATRGPKPILVIPMAGEGARFVRAGYKEPKPFINVAGKSMIQRVLENLDFKSFETVLLARAEHLARLPSPVRELIVGNSIRVVPVDQLTEGSVCTILLGRREIDRNAPLLIANCDQLVDFDCKDFIADCINRKLDGSILVFREPSGDPKWSYVRTDASGHVIEAREKVAISDLATVGIYFFAKAGDFIDAALDMIAHNDRVNNEFYTCPVYNYLIKQGQKVGIYEIPKVAMHGLGVPEDLERFLSSFSEGANIGTV
jgi:NDP-sugar pyrophosphorylase family protein